MNWIAHDLITKFPFFISYRSEWDTLAHLFYPMLEVLILCSIFYGMKVKFRAVRTAIVITIISIICWEIKDIWFADGFSFKDLIFGSIGITIAAYIEKFRERFLS